MKKKNLLPNSVHTRSGQEHPKKVVKKFKKLQNLFPTLFLAKTPIGRKREQKFLYRISSVLGLGMKIPKKNSKKIRKMKKPYSVIIYSQNGMIQVEKERKKF